MTPAIEAIDGQARSVLLLCDHASNHVPADLDLGIDAALLDKHIAVDIGAGALTRALAEALNAPACLARVSRLVIDLHRQSDHPGLIPVVSDGHAVPGNESADRIARIARFHAPYHRALGEAVERLKPDLIVAIHSFTAELEQDGVKRPWEIGVLYNRDDRAARIAIDALEARGIVTGDNQPYSGRQLNATLNRHGEGSGTPCASIEVRNDMIADAAGIAHWTLVLSEIIATIRNGVARKGSVAT